jgi:hypothetical protein
MGRQKGCRLCALGTGVWTGHEFGVTRLIFAVSRYPDVESTHAYGGIYGGKRGAYIFNCKRVSLEEWMHHLYPMQMLLCYNTIMLHTMTVQSVHLAGIVHLP